jgi:hypothetical protein
MKKMIPKERLISELKLKLLETKNENNWNEQTIFYIPPFYKGIINFSLVKLDDYMLSHIKNIIESIDSLSKIAKKHMKENFETNVKKDIWDVLSTKKVYLRDIIFYSDLSFCIKFEKYFLDLIAKKEYYNHYIRFNFTRDLTMENMFFELYPVHINFKFNGYPMRYIKEDNNCKKTDVDKITEEILEFNGKYQQNTNDDPSEENMYARCPQKKSVCVIISLNKKQSHYKAYAEYAYKNIPVNQANMNDWYFTKPFNYESNGILRTKYYPIRWLKKHNQEISGSILIPVKNMGKMYINCEIQNYKINKMEIINDVNILRKLIMDICEEDTL